MIMNDVKRRKPKKVVTKEKPNAKRVEPNQSKGMNGFYYSFFTIILILCLIQILISAIYNVSKVISYRAKIVQITKTRDAAQALNEQIKDNINNFSNVAGLEEIARDSLKMSSDDEVLVIINTPKEEETQEKQRKIPINFEKDKKR